MSDFHSIIQNTPPRFTTGDDYPARGCRPIIDSCPEPPDRSRPFLSGLPWKWALINFSSKRWNSLTSVIIRLYNTLVSESFRLQLASNWMIFFNKLNDNVSLNQRFWSELSGKSTFRKASFLKKFLIKSNKKKSWRQFTWTLFLFYW